MAIKVSVIIPTYNRARYIIEAVDSVLVQTYKDYEIIVVDDGSTDNTKEVLLPYMDRITYIYQSNKGVSAARNTGIKAAKGEWIAFLDSDDIWLPRKLEMQFNDIDCFDDIDLHICNGEFVNGDVFQDLFSLRKLKNNGWKIKFIEDPFCHLLKHKYSTLSSVLLMNKGLYFDEKMHILEDLNYMAKIALHSKKWLLRNDVLVRYIRRDEDRCISLTQRKAGDHYHTMLVNQELYKRLRLDVCNSCYSFKKIRLINMNLSNVYFDYAMKCRDLIESRFYLYKGLKTYISIKNVLKYIVYHFKRWIAEIKHARVN